MIRCCLFKESTIDCYEFGFHVWTDRWTLVLGLFRWRLGFYLSVRARSILEQQLDYWWRGKV